ncbi:TetR/AcrR family transcriptional regulator [Amycolatopsis sp. VC5-11]|uniref:TetR/AcrR family transcriptional regulator n=1 Tax=Amycolatopsis sp. VC5-11 TaxID=3120156 RepID=UPI003008B4F9
MSSARRYDASERLRVHLSQFDWSGQTPARRAALEAFLRLSNAHGFTTVTMRMLATELTIKAPSLYAYFPGGRDEIVAESLRWHFSKFGYAILAAVDRTETAAEFWDAMVREHLTRQVTLPESDLWDLLVATDAVVPSLPAGLHDQVDSWVAYYEDMYRAAAIDMGIDADVDEQIRLVLTVVEGARRWCSADTLPDAVARAIQVSHSLLRLPSADSSRVGA